MMTFDEILAELDVLQAADLTHWVEESWVKPLGEGGVLQFAEVDYVRVRFLCDMYYDLGVGDEALPILLGLVDQVYDLRRHMKKLGTAIEAQPEDVRRAIARLLEGGA